MDPLERTNGYDANGFPVQLGDTDSQGYHVGYIDLEGVCWESLEERDIATVAARYGEAWQEWNRSGGLLGQEPCAKEVAKQHCYDWHHIEAAAEAARRETDLSDPLTRLCMSMSSRRIAQQAQLN